jgi:hypothetical protein
MGGSRSGNHDEFAFEFIVGLCMRRGKAHGEKSTRRAIKTEPSITRKVAGGVLEACHGERFAHRKKIRNVED